ncbi:hypothetical protein [Phocaeicola plebeius]|uniref:hypothetical protein n=1 Tax=Phocaeicola plebeius TaxID=310297 RepID=UPI0022E30FC4|nr:hypothetical protein [Phocaeicola plebeius]
MKKIATISLLSVLLTSCVLIPKETVTLSQTIGYDLQQLHSSHYSMAEMQFKQIEENIDRFINDVYSPFIINMVLKSQLESYKSGDTTSLYYVIETAGKSEKKEDTEEALQIMMEFTEAANKKIALKREELMQPILSQKKLILDSINSSYRNTIYANTTLTAYLESARKVKESQNKALSLIKLDGIDSEYTRNVFELSSFVDNTLKQFENIDMKSDNAIKQIDELINNFKNNVK